MSETKTTELGRGAWIRYTPDWLSRDEADTLLEIEAKAKASSP